MESEVSQCKRVDGQSYASGLFSILAAKSLPHSVDIDLRLMCQMRFSLIQHQKPAYHACLSSALTVLQIRHCSCSLITLHAEHSATALFQTFVESNKVSPGASHPQLLPLDLPEKIQVKVKFFSCFLVLYELKISSYNASNTNLLDHAH